MIRLLNRKGRLLDLLGKVICSMFQGLLICLVHVVLIMLDILEKIICKAFQMLGKLDILGKAGEMLGKLKEKVKDTALERVAEESWNTGTSFYSLGSDMQSLGRDLIALTSRASDIKEEVERAEVSGKKRRKTEVKTWLKDVEQLETEFNELKRKLQEERSWKHLLGGAVVSGMKNRISSLTEQSRNFRGLLLDVGENGQNNN